MEQLSRNVEQFIMAAHRQIQSHAMGACAFMICGQGAPDWATAGEVGPRPIHVRDNCYDCRNRPIYQFARACGGPS